MSSVLHRLCTEGQKYGAEYESNGSPYLSTHLPMALFAFQQMGASDARLESFYHFYTQKLVPKQETGQSIDASNWSRFLGRHTHNVEYVAFFSEEHKKMGRAALLQKYLPLLFPGVGAGAFHPLIRLAYAIEMQNDSEVVEALAAWAMAYLPLDFVDGPARSADPLPLLNTLSANPHFRNGNYTGSTIVERMEKVGQDSEFSGVADWLDVERASLDSLAEAALCLYDSTSHFTLLHCVTGLHALRVVLPMAGPPEIALRFFWQAFCAAYITVGTPLVKPLSPPPSSLPSWDQIFEHAIPSNDEHVCKLVYTCFREEEHYKNPGYRIAASRKAGLIC